MTEPLTTSKSSNAKTRWIVILCTLLGLFVLVLVGLPYADAYVAGPLKGWYNRTFAVPPVLSASYVEELDPEQAKAQVEKLVSVYQSHQGNFGLRRTITSVRGTRIDKCLVTENGALTFVIDLTRDPDGNRRFSVAHPEGLRILPPDEDTNRPAAGETALAEPYVVTYLQGRGIFF